MKESIPEDLIGVAQVVKSYGTIGGIIIKIFTSLPLSLKEPVFIYFDELPVPFFIESMEAKGASGAVVKLETIDDIDRADELAGKQLYIESTQQNESDSFCLKDEYKNSTEDYLSEYDMLAGFAVKNQNNLFVGNISAFLDIPNNPCIEIELAESFKDSKNDKTALIPLHEDLIMDMDFEKRILQIRIPQGLLNEGPNKNI